MNKPLEQEKKELILLLWELEDEWERHTQPGYNSIGLYAFRRINDVDELRIVVEIQNKIKRCRKELRKLLGTLKYIQFVFAPLSTFKSL